MPPKELARSFVQTRAESRDLMQRRQQAQLEQAWRAHRRLQGPSEEIWKSDVRVGNVWRKPLTGSKMTRIIKLHEGHRAISSASRSCAMEISKRSPQGQGKWNTSFASSYDMSSSSTSSYTRTIIGERFSSASCQADEDRTDVEALPRRHRQDVKSQASLWQMVVLAHARGTRLQRYCIV